MSARTPRCTLFPYTTLFRSSLLDRQRVAAEQRGALRELAGEILLPRDRKSTRLNSSHMSISYAVLCLKKKKLRLVLDVGIVGHRHRHGHGAAAGHDGMLDGW